ncbi:MAG: YqzL family protein [Epulopiscium sp.]|nr:YqzL family protein [Candidatus Epulonipiscium sp.]
MYVEQLWKYFEETGSIETYLDIKRYERLYNEHTSSGVKDNDIEQVSDSDLDGMK